MSDNEQEALLDKYCPDPRSGHIAAILDDYLFVHGGYNGVSYDDMWQYHLVSGEWKELEVSGDPPGRDVTVSHSGVIIGRKLYMMGGTGPEFGQTLNAHLRAFDCDTFIWTVVPQKGDIPPVRYGQTLTSLPGSASQAVLFGGVTTFSFTNDLYILDVSSGTDGIWTNITAAVASQHTPGLRPLPILSPGSGGESGSGAGPPAAWVAGGEVEVDRHYPAPRYRAGVVAADPSTLYVLGGGRMFPAEDNNNVLPVWKIFLGSEDEAPYSVRLNPTSAVVVNGSQTFPVARTTLTATLVGNSIYVIGGMIDSYAFPDESVWILDLVKNEWSCLKLSRTHLSRAFHTACLWREGAIVVFGGRTPSRANAAAPSRTSRIDLVWVTVPSLALLAAQVVALTHRPLTGTQEDELRATTPREVLDKVFPDLAWHDDDS